jgi:hypothetical protein
MPVLPLGLACVAEAVQNAGHEIKLVDLMNENDGRLVLGDAISEFQPEIIGISVRNIDDQCMEKPRFLLDSVKDEARNRFLQYHAVRGQHWSKLHFSTVKLQKP